VKGEKLKVVNKTLLLLFFSFWLFISLCVNGCAGSKSKQDSMTPSQEDTGRKVIQSIDFIGNDSIKTKTLLKKLDFKVGNYLDGLLAESSCSVLSEYYRRKGFADVRVSLDLVELSLGKVVYTIEEGPRIRIKSVDFEGNKAIKTGNLKSVIKTQTRNWLLQPVYYTKEKITADEQKLRSTYFQRGFLNHKISSTGRENIVFLIEEGPQYDVGKIIISGNTYFDSQTLLKGLELKPGRVYLPPQAAAHAQKILDRYLEHGFINAKIEQQHLFAQDGNNVVDVEFSITQGRQFRIGRIDISGNEQTQDKVYRRILDEYKFTPGELYNARIASVQGEGELNRNLQQMTMADEVLISPVTPGDGNDVRRDARINVKEGLTGMINPGVAIGSDSGVIGQLMWTQKNFDITDWPRNFEEFITMQSFRGAGQSLRVALEPGTEVSRYSVSFTEPYFLDKPVSFTLAGSIYERWFESYDEKRKRLFAEFEKRYRSGWRNSIGLRAENVRVGSLEPDAPQEIIDVKGNNMLVGTEFGIALDKTNNRFTPSDGFSVKVGYEQVTGDFDFGILSSTGVLYKTLYEDFIKRKTILATKVLFATTVSDAPPFEKFYAGGTGTYGIRGFEYRGISTRGLQTNVAFPVYKDPIGSDWIFLANSELSIPLIGNNVSLLFFMDSGTIDTGPYRSSAGTGLQVLIPNLLGPVPMRFTYGVPMRKGDSDETQYFSFFMGSLF
jgi:outer membrane protein insertion porin family